MSFAPDGIAPPTTPRGHDAVRKTPDPGRTSRAPQAVVIAAVAAIGLVGIVDYASGPYVSVSFFYLVPVAIVTAAAGRRAGLACVLLSGTVEVVSDIILGGHSRHQALAAWNTACMLVTLAVVVELVSRITRRAQMAIDAELASREFLAMAAHQLRTPVAGIRSSAEALLMSDPDVETAQLLLAGLCQQAARASQLVGSLLRMARLDQHEPLPFARVDLVALAERAVRDLATLTPGLMWRVQSPDADELLATCNAHSIAEAVSNLLDNARRHATTTVSVVIRDGGNTAEVNVTDDGPGLPAGTASLAFERFVTLDGQGGTGLGLPIARAIAEAHEGRLDYDTGTFVLRIPKGLESE